jgi:transcriptional regulator GlxA family with amidase domain
MPDEIQAPLAINEPVYTANELAEKSKLHPSTIRRLFRAEPGVITLGRQHLTLRIPASVARRVLQNLTVAPR